jgi:hypothetical protein
MRSRRGAQGAPENSSAEADVDELRRKLRTARQNLRKVREDRDALRRSRKKAQRELDVLRAFTLDMFPDIDVPERVREVMAAVREENLTYLADLHLTSLVTCVLEAERAGRKGLIVEAGTALGGSAIAMAAAKDPARPMRVYDVFGMIPPPSERDGEDVIRRYEQITEGQSSGLAGEVYYGYREDLLGEVTASFARHGVPVEENQVTLVQGLFQDTIEIDEPVALAHVDGDWYDSTMTCLERITPHLVVGGRIVIDDYFMWSGCREAVDEYFADRPGFRVERRAKVHIVRLPEDA